MGNSSPRADNQSAICLCIGAANIDIRCAFEKSGVEGTSNPAIISQMVGGAALNTARNVALADINCTFIGLAADDEGGKMIAGALQDAGVSNGLVLLENQTTSHYISMLEQDGTLNIAANDMRIHAGLTPALLEPQLNPALMRDAREIFIDTNIPVPTIDWLGNKLQDKRLFATTVSPSKARRLAGVIDRLDVLFTNVAEAAVLFGVSQPQASAAKLAKMLAASPIPRGTLSDGKNPLWYWQNGRVTRLKIPFHANIKDVTGAGDALAGGVIAAMHLGARFGDAVLDGIDMAQKVLKVEGPYYGRFQAPEQSNNRI